MMNAKTWTRSFAWIAASAATIGVAGCVSDGSDLPPMPTVGATELPDAALHKTVPADTRAPDAGRRATDAPSAGDDAAIPQGDATAAPRDAARPSGDAASPVAAAIKFHPGHYIELDSGSGCGKLPCYQSVIASLAGQPGIVGVFLIQPWSQFEGNEGDYSAGFALIDALLSAASAAHLQLMIGVQGKVFGTYHPSSGSYGELPPYFDTLVCADGPPGYISATANGVSGSLLETPKNYDPCVTTHRIAMVTAYGARYDANPNFEMWADEDETANGLYTSSSQYDGDVTQDIAWAIAARAAFPTTQLRLTTNFFDTAQQFTNLFSGIAPYGIGVGGPDVSLDLPGSPPFPGTDAIVFNGWEDGTDWRNVLPRLAEVQWGDSAESGGVTQAQLYAEEYTGTSISGGSTTPNYFIWGASQQNPSWTLSSTVSFIASINGKVNRTCPSAIKCN